MDVIGRVLIIRRCIMKRFALIFIVFSLVVSLIQQAGPSLLQNLENMPVPSVDSNTLQQMEGI